jgi:hypothetical protein
VFRLRKIPRKAVKRCRQIAIFLTPFRGPGDWNPLPLLLRKFTAGSI